MWWGLECYDNAFVSFKYVCIDLGGAVLWFRDQEDDQEDQEDDQEDQEDDPEDQEDGQEDTFCLS